MNSRRRFLQTILLASGAAFAGVPLGCRDQSKTASQKRVPPRPALSTSSQRFSEIHRVLIDNSSDPTADSTRTCDVVVVGAGPSGLTACRTLHKLGVDALLVESEARPGGAAVNGQWRGVSYPLGSVYLVEYEGLIKDMLDEAGVQAQLAPEDAVVLNNQAYLDFWKDSVIDSLPVPTTDKTAMRRFRDDLLKLAVEPVYPLPASLAPDLAALDAMSARQFLQKYNSELLNSILNVYALSSMGGTIDEVNAYCLLDFYSGEFGAEYNLPRYTFPGGLHQFASAIAKPLPAEAQLYEHIAFDLANTNSGVRLKCIDNNGKVLEIRAKAAVVALQKFAVPFLIADLPAVQKDAISKLRYSPFATIHLCSTRELLPYTHFDTWVLGQEQYFTDILNPSSLAERKASSYVYSLYSPRPVSDRSILMSPELFANFARRAAEAALPVLGGEQAGDAIEEMHCWAWGHSLIRAAVGSHNGVAQQASRPFGHIFFANTDNDASPSVESAVHHGLMAAESAERHLRSTVGKKTVYTPTTSSPGVTGL